MKMNESTLSYLARCSADNQLSRKSDVEIEDLIRTCKVYVENAVNDPHTGWCSCERCAVIGGMIKPFDERK